MIDREEDRLQRIKASIEAIPSKISTIRAWLENRTLNKGHIDNPTNQSEDSLDEQEVKQKINTLSEILKSSQIYGVENNLLTEDQFEEIKEEIETLKKSIFENYVSQIPQKLSKIKDWIENPTLSELNQRKLTENNEELIREKEILEKLDSLTTTLENSELYGLEGGVLTQEEFEQIRERILELLKIIFHNYLDQIPHKIATIKTWIESKTLSNSYNESDHEETTLWEEEKKEKIALLSSTSSSCIEYGYHHKLLNKGELEEISQKITTLIREIKTTSNPYSKADSNK